MATRHDSHGDDSGHDGGGGSAALDGGRAAGDSGSWHGKGADTRLDDLRRRIDARRARRERDGRRRGGDPRAAAHHLVLRLLADLGVALAAGLLLGWLIDHYLGSRPWGLLVGMLLGIAAGVRNVMHTADSASRADKSE